MSDAMHLSVTVRAQDAKLQDQRHLVVKLNAKADPCVALEAMAGDAVKQMLAAVEAQPEREAA